MTLNQPGLVRTNALHLALLAMGALAAGACGATDDDLESAAIAEALELEQGGLDMEDEAPMFADAARFEEAELAEESRPVDDELGDDEDVRQQMERPDGVHYRVVVQWGQIPGNRENETARDWSGIFKINRGAMLVRRTIAFDQADTLLRRDDRTEVPFISFTLPHRDGLVLDIVDPDPSNAEPMTLGYIADLPGRLGAEDGAYRIPLRSLLDGRVEVLVDDADNRMVAAAHARPLDVCDHGFLMGRWHRVSPEGERARGRFLGRVVSEDGSPRGHVRGVYGERRDGSQVFFGKYINRAGAFQGILAGTYGDNQFDGRWITRAEEKGSVAGRYRENPDSPRPAGHFLGRWQEHTCNVR